jgi:methylamine dehydrogenase heavy chain
VPPAWLWAASETQSDRYPKPLPPDSDIKVLALPATYPSSWALISYPNDKFELLEVGDDDREIRGQLAARESAIALFAHNRSEIYVADTVWSRGNRGLRTDFITVYDKSTLLPKAEIELPGAKRALVVPMEGMFTFANAERLALVFNFTPAGSVTVVDLAQRKVLSTIETPGCSLAYSSGPRGFASFCSGGTLISVQLDTEGRAISRHESPAFNDLDHDPLFTSSAAIAGVRYFPSFNGRVRPIDFSGAVPEILSDWSLVSSEERQQNWRPSGLQLAGGGDDGRLYVIMQPNAHEGSHKEPGTEVWVFDTRTRSRVSRLRLVRPGVSVEVTHDREPLLLVATSDQLDVYALPHGNLLRSLDAPARRGGLLMEAMH